MKKFTLTIVLAVIAAMSAFAQAPEMFNYQSVVRDNAGNILANQPVTFRISILQGSAGGAAVYTETHTDTTNAYGLSVLKIGGGTSVNGTMSAINWANGLYFIQVELDQTGGNTYVLMGTTQCVSVPYAIHSKTSDSITGTITETDPKVGTNTTDYLSKWNGTSLVTSSLFDNGNVGIGTNTPNASAALEISSNTQGFLPPRLSYTEIQAISNPAEGLIVYNTCSKTLNVYNGTRWVDMNGNLALIQIGDLYAGGIVFYVTYDNCEQHGLVCAPSDQGAVPWGCYGTAITGADGTAVGTGNQNTTDIVTGCTEAGIAAKICYELDLNGYSDWFLPSKDELNLMYVHLKTQGLGSFLDDYYWSSSEYNADMAWDQSFWLGWQLYHEKYYTGYYYVRAVRAF